MEYLLALRTQGTAPLFPFQDGRIVVDYTQSAYAPPCGCNEGRVP